ncbi:MAG TPA: hypothetical protein VND24_11140 [Steroidobacteraceae bacterium]|nr:hypothetical protein [Steroidobacteraceae bacterium]
MPRTLCSMAYLVCRSCGHQNETSARRCERCGATEEHLRAGADLGPWWPLIGILGILAALEAAARAIGGDAILAWLAVAAAVCLASGAQGLRRGALRFRGRGPAGSTARLQSAALVVLGLAALAIFIARLVRGA